MTTLGLLSLAVGCTFVQSTVSSVFGSDSLDLTGAKVAVLPFAGAPGRPDTGQSAREISAALLVGTYRVSLISPPRVDAYSKHESMRPTERDRERLEAAAKALKADVLIWGSVDRFTPYRFDRPSPATPPEVEITLFGFRSGGPGVVRVTGQKRGETPDTTWRRPPTFEDVTQPLIAELLVKMR